MYKLYYMGTQKYSAYPRMRGEELDVSFTHALQEANPISSRQAIGSYAIEFIEVGHTGDQTAVVPAAMSRQIDLSRVFHYDQRGPEPDQIMHSTAKPAIDPFNVPLPTENHIKAEQL